jgi:diguanylate cyclase (GGDEF)-like protein
VNDTVGHHIGDMVLTRAGEVFLSRVRRTDTVARTGGDEFSIILEEPTSRDDANTVSLSLIQLLDEPVELDGHIVRVGASVGIAVYPEDATTAEALCIAADRRMYSDKNASRGETAARIEPAFVRPFAVLEKRSSLQAR